MMGFAALYPSYLATSLPEEGVNLSEFDVVPSQGIFVWPDAWFNF